MHRSRIISRVPARKCRFTRRARVPLKNSRMCEALTKKTNERIDVFFKSYVNLDYYIDKTYTPAILCKNSTTTAMSSRSTNRSTKGKSPSLPPPPFFLLITHTSDKEFAKEQRGYRDRFYAFQALYIISVRIFARSNVSTNFYTMHERDTNRFRHMSIHARLSNRVISGSRKRINS